ncbi:Gfo/Idh/MocA family oxidoreductase [Mesorhizobium sp.]|uniref:Gfo/Idh/MocA family protein n=1 Tax=Mesorhizobium sp. TaxID=1871066 RepID=UPI000FE4B3C0|nr:Gfo/Idh/MocA family oxidoreductase [Mesorhizobium sp.]RWA79134.1 MAG: Gfo/Idh/MocA family oxidoreductase [Mesorhizobium sp.]
MIGVGIIGAGHFGAAHARAIEKVDGVRLVAACRNDEPALGAFTAEHGGRGYRDWRALVEDGEVDAVLIATPHHLHTEMAIGAAQAGKHILLEKPMAPTAAACDAINAAASANGVKLMVGHLMHFSRPCMTAKEALAEGSLGRPLIASSWMIKLWMEQNRQDWHIGHGTGGGMLMTAGIHALDRLVWLMDDDVVSVGAMLGAKFHDQEADDASMLSLRFAGGGIGQVQSVGYRDGAVNFAMDLVCEHGTLRIDMDRGTSLGRGTRLTDLPNSFEPDWMHNAVIREWTHMRDAILDDAPVPVTGDYGRNIIAIIEAAYRSNESRREEELV